MNRTYELDRLTSKIKEINIETSQQTHDHIEQILAEYTLKPVR